MGQPAAQLPWQSILSRQNRADGDKAAKLQGGVVTAALLLAPKARRIHEKPTKWPLLLIRLEPEMQDPSLASRCHTFCLA
jgi:hypothetical protein